MKKIYITLLLITAVQLSAFAYESYPGEDIVKKIDDASIKALPKKMEKLWNEFCGINPIFCEAMQPKYNDALFNAKVRQQEKKRQMWNNIARGLAGGTIAASRIAVPKQSYYIAAPSATIPNPIYDNRPTSYTVYGQNSIVPIGKIKVNYGPFGGF